MMTREDYEAQLQSVNAAIAAIEGGAQEYKIGSRSVRRGELATLYAERRRLEDKLDRFDGCATVAVIGRRY